MRMLMLIIFVLGISALSGCEKTIREAGGDGTGDVPSRPAAHVLADALAAHEAPAATKF